MKMTTEEFVAKVSEMAAEVKALFPPGYTAYDGKTYEAGIQERADASIYFVTVETKLAHLPSVLGRFAEECETYRKIAAKAEKKGWPKRG